MMEKSARAVMTVQELLSVDAIGRMGLVVRFMGADGNEHHIQLPTREAHALADMMRLAMSHLAAPGDGSRQ